MRQWIVQDWRKGKKWLSVWFMGIGGSIQGAWAAFPDSLRSVIPDRYSHWIAVSFFVCGFVSRFVNQSGKSNGPQPPPD